jgi:adenosylmethionine-8-amino-7-oxononanoate aminotransferase
MPGNIHVAQPNEYRCTFCRDRGGCNLECAQDVGRAIEHEGPSSVAAFIGEPISAASGIHVPHPEYWPTIREICDRYGVLMICDEVITGFGRTGRMFATEHWDVTPDIFTVAKAMTSGYLPIGGAIATKKVADAFAGDGDSTFRHLITFGGNPACCAAGIANLEIMENEGMVENSAQMGDYLFESLQTLYEHPIVGDVRGGKGLICGVELVKNRDTREKFSPEDKLAEKLTPIVARRGLLGRFGDIVPVAPPLCVTKDEIDFLVNAIGDSIAELQSTL